MYDAIVIGARLAGAATAMLLARRGRRVLLVDRATFPSEVPRGHFIHRHGPSRLADWGLLDRVLETNSPPVTSMRTDFGDFVLAGDELEVDGVPMGLGPRRAKLDQVLVEAAVEAGAELREGFAVHELLVEAGRVTGVRGRAVKGGSEARERAAVVIGADGRNSMVARTVGARTYESHPTLTCWFFSYWSGAPSPGLELYVRGRRAIFAFPTNDGLTAIFVAWPIEELDAVRADTERELLAVVDSFPEFGERVRAGRREERILGATQLPNFLRSPYGPGWALVGDAGCHKDPFLALGVCDALRDAELLADSIDHGLDRRKPLEEALAGYEIGRNKATLPDFHENLELARLDPPREEVRALRAAVRDDPEQSRRFHLAREGMIPRESFFNDENLGRLIAGAGAPAA